MRQALLSAPGHPAATANLGAFMRITGEARGGRGAAARQPRARARAMPAPGSTSSPMLLQEERVGRRAGAARRRPGAARGQRRRCATGICSDALALLQLGRAGRGAAGARRAGGARSDPARTRAAVALAARAAGAARRTTAPRAREQAEQMAAALDGDGARRPCPNIRSWRITIWPSSGRARTSTTRAFAHWQAGHALLQPLPAVLARGACAPSSTRTSRSSTAPGSQTAPRAGNADPAPVFIVGMPRSGTTLCEQILAAHAQVHGAGERVALGADFRGARRRGTTPQRRCDASPRSMPRRSTRRPRATSPSCTRWRRTRPASSTRCRATTSISAWSG